jgi:hypothetical protein
MRLFLDSAIAVVFVSSLGQATAYVDFNQWAPPGPGDGMRDLPNYCQDGAISDVFLKFVGHVPL